jgi:hypothetical protein
MSTWNDELVEQLEWHWTNQAKPRLDGLSDDEYLWEPVEGAWSIRPRREAVAKPVGRGDVIIDFDFPEPRPAPVTTIAWRMGHLSIGVFGARAANHFGVPGDVDYDTTEWPITAKEGLELLDRQYAAWMDGVRSLGEAGLARPCGPAEGPYADAPFSKLVLHINREAIHHLAEVALLRDLYTHRSTLAGARS